MLVRKSMWGVVLAFSLTIALAACGGAPIPVPMPTPMTTQAPATEAPAEESTAAPTAAPAEEAAPAATTAPAENASTVPVAGDARAFRIDPNRSEVSFTLTELLMGNPTTVVGVSNAVTGDVTVNLRDYALTAIGPITIQAETLTTDNNFRNRAIRNFILQTGQHPTITFTPTAIEGLPDSAAVGNTLNLTVAGDLTIRTTTQPVSFALTVTPLSETELEGIATTTVLRGDFDLQIPEVPSVADVSDEVVLQINFVAVAE